MRESVASVLPWIVFADDLDHCRSNAPRRYPAWRKQHTSDGRLIVTAQANGSARNPLQLPIADAALTYWIDTAQRCLLLVDTLRERGNVYQRQTASKVPNVLS